jgi:hypothetical protein
MALADNEMLLKNVRITTFGQQTIYTAKAFPGGKDPTPYYSLNAILPKDHPQIPQIEAQMLAAANKKFGDKKGAGVLKAAKLIGKVPLRDGDIKADYDGFEGNMFLSARSAEDKGRPQVVNNLRQPVQPGDPNAPYDGCYADLVISFYGYDKGNNGIGCGLKVVQYRGKGDRFSGAGKPVDLDDLEEIAVNDEDDINS